ncbi:CoF synthetase [Mariniflexile ostreae]|uniref:CoF synthetase n=1 Tax=Mariniflexile ostreae TaxID=1520892 RepID=A0ABV5FDS4_9FLAO
MLSFNNPRYYLFNVFDAITGRKKNKHYNDVKHIIEHGDINKTSNYIAHILNHAKASVPFYAAYKHVCRLEGFPVINKNIIKDNFDEFQSLSYINKKKVKKSTSGSTGVPFKSFQNKDKTLRNAADNLYFSGKAGYTIGNKLFYFRMWHAFEKKGMLTKWVQNIKPIEVFDLNDTYLAKLVEQLKSDKTPKSFIGYASTFEQLCKFLDKTNAQPMACNLQSAIAISEHLSPYTKNALKTYFNVDTVSRYSNVENGIIAQQFPGTSYFIINTASYHVEILELNADLPVPEGTKGRIVITDLFNYCMPMIRYDTGDIGTIAHIDGHFVLTEVEGRKIDAITNTKGEIISNNILLLINNYHELNQCQLIQKKANHYVFKINIDGEFKKEAKFIADFKSHLGHDAHIEMDYVNEIPLLASGKRRVMVNDMTP